MKRFWLAFCLGANILGHVTIDRHKHLERLFGGKLRLMVDGQDVTERCVEANAGAGWAICLTPPGRCRGREFVFGPMQWALYR